MNLRGKTFSRMIACTLIAGLTVPYVLPSDITLNNAEVSAEDAVAATLLSAADTFVGNPAEMKRCAVYNDGSKSFNMNGRTFKQGVVLNENTYNETAHVIYDVTDINKITMTFGHVDSSGTESTEISVFVDDELADKFTLTPNAPLRDVDIDTSAGSKLRIERTGTNTKYAFADVKVDGVKSLQTVTVPKYNSAAAFMASAFNNIRTTPYDGTNTEKFFNLNGRQYYQGIILGNNSYSEGCGLSFNVENVDTISFSLCHLDNSRNEDDEIQVFLDDELDERFPVKCGELVQNVTIDVKDAKTLRFYKSSSLTRYAVADITIDGLAPEKAYNVPVYKNAATFLSTVFDNYRSTVYDGSSAATTFGLNGRSYCQGIILGDGSYSEGSAVSLNVENLKSIEFTIGHLDNSVLTDGEVQIFLDNELVEKIPQPYNAPLTEYKLDVSKASVLKLYKPGERTQYAVANIKADELVSKNTFTIPAYKNSAAFMTSSYNAYRTTAYDGLSAATTFGMSGRKYRQGFVLGDGTYTNEAALSLNVENLKTLSFDLGHVDDSDTSASELVIMLDNETVDKATLTYDMPIRKYTLDVSEAKNVRFYRNGNRSQYAIGDLIADELTPKNANILPKYETAEKFIDSAYDSYRIVKYLGDNKFNYFTMNGTDFGQGITMGENGYADGARAVFNVENVNSISFNVGSLNEGNKDATLEVYIDNGKADTISLTGDMKNTYRHYDLSEASRLMIVKTGAQGIYGLGDIKIAEGEAQIQPTAVPTVIPSTVIPTAGPTAVTPTVAPTSVIPIPTVDVSISPAPTNITATPTSVTSVIPTATPVDPSPVPTTVPTEEPIQDINGDGETTPADVRLILKHIVGTVQLSDTQLKAADANGDGKIDSMDAVVYLKIVVGAE